MGKKKLDVMAKEREVFIHGQVDDDGNIIVPGCVRNGIDEVSANKIFDEMAEFAKYAFNKSHAACYAVVAYRTAYLKAYYPAEFMAATLNSYLGNLDKIPQYIDECKRLKIEILKPDINKSISKFMVEDGKIRFGLGSIKNVGLAPINAIIEERTKNGNYEGFTDFCERIAGEAVNKKCIESLIKAGVFEEFEQTRSTLLASYEDIIDQIVTMNKKGLDGQVTMFDLGGEEEEKLNEIKYTFTQREELTEKELLSMEKEMLGIYISGHPLEKLRTQIEQVATINTIQLKEIDEQMSSSNNESVTIRTKFKDGQNVKYIGIITKIKKKYTKTNKIMAFVTIEDLYGTAEFIVFENAYMKAGNSLVEENIVVVDGRLSIREEEATSIIANDIKTFEGVKKREILTIDITNLNEEQKEKLRVAIRYFRGKQNNFLIQVKVGEDYKPCGGITYSEKVRNTFEDIAGKENVTII
jgi:DNA polymerase-3 subunit alpha